MTPEFFARITCGHALFITSLPDVRGGGFIKSALCHSADDVAAFLRRYDKPTQSVYFAASHLREGETERRKDTLAGTSHLWCDIDFKHHPDLDAGEIIQRLVQSPKAPNLIWHTGGGLQCIWHLKDTGPTSTAEIESALRAAAHHVGGDPAVCEAARLLRVPGSHNGKHGERRLVEVLYSRPGDHVLSDLVSVWSEDDPIIPAPLLAARANGHDPAAAADPYETFGRESNREPIDADDLLDAMVYPGNVHSTQIRVALSLVRRGVPIDEITDRILTATRRAAGADGAKWDWAREANVAIRKGAIGSAFKKLSREYDAATGEIPAWVPDDLKDRFAEVLTEGGRPSVAVRADRGAYVMDVGAIGKHEAKAPGSPRDEPPKAEAASSGSADKGGAREFPGPKGRQQFVFDPKPYVAPDPKSIPRRQWLYGRHYLRGVVSASLGAPGRLKSTTSLTEAVGMVVKRDLIHGRVLEECGQLRVAYLNGEENQDELDRRFAAICKHYGISEQQYAGRIWVISTRDNAVRVAKPGPKAGGAAIVRDVVDGLVAWCDANGIDVLIVDPLISFHGVRENDSGDMDSVCKEGFGVIAGKTRSVELVAHPRKSAPGEVNTTVEDMRGSSAQLAAVRTARTFNFMTTNEATRLGIEEDARRLYVRIENGKGGPGPLGKANWVKIEVETLANGDDVAVAVRWRPPERYVDYTPAQVNAVVALVKTGEFIADVRAEKWLGWEVALIFGMKARYAPGRKGRSANSPIEIARIEGLLEAWEKAEILAVEERVHEKRRDRTRRVYVVGPGPLPLFTDTPSDDVSVEI